MMNLLITPNTFVNVYCVNVIHCVILFYKEHPTINQYCDRTLYYDVTYKVNPCYLCSYTVYTYTQKLYCTETYYGN